MMLKFKGAKVNYHFSIVLGDIITAKADYIVNASNTAMRLGSGVSGALKRVCGSELERAMQEALNKRLNLGSLTQGEVLKTASFGLEAGAILHAAVMNYTDKSAPKAPSLDTIRQILKNIQKLILADIASKSKASKSPSEGISLALPLLGCGVGGLKASEVAGVMREFFTPNKTHKIPCHAQLFCFSKRDFDEASSKFKRLSF